MAKWAPPSVFGVESLDPLLRRTLPEMIKTARTASELRSGCGRCKRVARMRSSLSGSPLAQALAVASLVAAGLLSRPSMADDHPSSAAEWVRLGVQEYKRSDYESARVAFAHAYDVEPAASTLISLALAELQCGHAVEAVRHMRAYVRNPGADPVKVEMVRTKWLPRAEEQTSRLVVEAPAGAEVLVDGQSEGTAPLADPVDLSVGEHEVVARLGSWSRSMHVTTTVGQTSLHFEVAEPAAPSVAPETRPSSQQPPWSTLSEKSTVGRGPSMAKIITVASIGTAAIVAVGLGVLYTFEYQSEASRFSSASAALSSPSACYGSNANSSQCTTLQQDLQLKNRDYGLAFGLYDTGALLAGATLATWLLWPNQKTQSAWFMRPAVSSRTEGVIFGGTF